MRVKLSPELAASPVRLPARSSNRAATGLKPTRRNFKIWDVGVTLWHVGFQDSRFRAGVLDPGLLIYIYMNMVVQTIAKPQSPANKRVDPAQKMSTTMIIHLC